MYSVLPPQKVSFSKKTKAWREMCIEAISSMGNTRTQNGRTSYERKQTNYDLVNSIFNKKDFKYVLDPYGLGDKNQGNQAEMRDINLMVNKVNRLKGEEMERPFDYHVMAVNGNALSAKEGQEQEMLLYVAQNKLAKELGIPQEEIISPETGEVEPPEDFPQVAKWKASNMKDVREQWGNDILTHLKHEQKLPLKFNEGWEHGLVVAEEYYYVGITNNQPIVRVCNPLNCEFDRNPDNPNIEDGDWFREDRWMTVGQILDEYGEHMTEAQIKKLDQGDLKQGLSNQMFPEYAYSQGDMNAADRGSSANNTRSNSTHLLVTHCVWKSMKKIGFVRYIDENDEEEETLVDEQFKLTPEMEAAGYTIEWTWVPDVWHGSKIAEDMILNVEPMPNQSRSMDNPRSVKLPYVGRVYNCTNSVQTSLIDLLKPHQYLYNIVWYRLETELAKAKGKKMVMDIAMIPKSEGIDLDKWMYFFDNVGLAFVNSFEEGKEKFQGQTSNFNQFTSIDMGLSQAVGQYITILTKIEGLMDRVVGIPQQSEGDTKASETATGVQTSVTQSSYITEPWFYIHNEIKLKVLEALIETAKFAYPGQKKLQYITDDVQRVFMTVDMDKFADSDYGCFITNSGRESKIFAKLEQLADRALMSGTAVFSDVIKMFKSNSVSELSNLIEESEAKRDEQSQRQAKADQESQQQAFAAAAEEKAADQAFLANENQLDRENDIRKTVIGTMGFDDDVQGNGVNDVVAYGNLALKQVEVERKHNLEERKLSQDTNDKSQDRQLEEKKIASKEKIEKLKADTALKNKVSGEK
tara:strand:- start:9031 stop:11448 length:2418 start_codon:yes stop_codon:yes gene_type:complete